MSLLHAWFSVGAVSGALFGSLMAGIGITPTAHFIITALALLLPLYIAYQALPADQIEHVSSKQYFAIAHGPLVALGIIGILRCRGRRFDRRLERRLHERSHGRA